MATEPKPIIDEQPDVSNPLAAFYHLFQLDKHDYESEQDYQDRLVARDEFIRQLEEQKINPSAYLQLLQERYGD